MDSRAIDWKKSGMLPSDVDELSLAECELFVNKDNVWGYEVWDEWLKRGLNGADLYYIYKIKQILPDGISRTRIEVQQGNLGYLYEDYVEQVYAIKVYLLEQAKRGILNYATWLDDLYLMKGWGEEIESIYGNRIEYSNEIGWEEVVTPELLRFVHSFVYEGTKDAFMLEYYCQDFPRRVSDGLYNPRIELTEGAKGVIQAEIRVSDFAYKGTFGNKGMFMQWLKSGGFADRYYKTREKFLTEGYVEPEGSTENDVSRQMQDSGKLCTIKRYRLTPNNVKVYQVEDKRGNRVEMSEGAVRDNIVEGRIIVHGLDVMGNGQLHWIKAPQLVK